jgi:hypothetical protein
MRAGRNALVCVFVQASGDPGSPGTGDWLSGRAPRSHRGGHWFDPSIAHSDPDQWPGPIMDRLEATPRVVILALVGQVWAGGGRAQHRPDPGPQSLYTIPACR